MATYSITPIPAFNDNYIWLIHDTQHAWAVDPGEALPVLHYLNHHQLTLAGILLTHHHADHCGGVATLRQHYPSLTVIGSPKDPLPPLTRAVQEGDTLLLAPLDLTVTVIEVPGHTLGHVAYFGDQCLFCGDTLFAGGCGRVFEGTAEQMWHSLDKLNQLPASTRIYCAHEYTESNLTFAIRVEPDNPDLQQRLQQVRAARSQHQITLPSLLAWERQTNPFLRLHEPTILHHLEEWIGHPLSTDPAQRFSVLRQWKNLC
ncbi:MAG: hydroxyacylglutathione hydrolase [Betaproteobacteria bacterium]|jgi:hydroxyacylglutathione hydrolase|nr:hydroxyacylglutathione hydrolase [Betaproteobacteria bacterium]